MELLASNAHTLAHLVTIPAPLLYVLNVLLDSVLTMALVSLPHATTLNIVLFVKLMEPVFNAFQDISTQQSAMLAFLEL